jgi:flagellar hook-associated protein 3 FlgL
MSMRVATFASTGSLLTAALRVQAEEAKITTQQSSALVSSDYGGYGSSSGRVVDLDASITRSKAYAAAATTADNRVTQMYSAVDSMVDLITNFKSDLISFDVSVSDDSTATLAEEAADALESLSSLLNSRWDGRYLFAGSAVDTAPVDTDALTAQTAPSSADTSYYRGDDTIVSVKVGAERTVSYGVTADEDAFEAAIRALTMIAAGTADEDTLSEASELLDTAIDGMAAIQSGLSRDASDLETAVSDQEDYQDFASSLVSEVTEVDIAEAAAKLSTYQAQLEAAYAAIGKIQSLSLSSYLD